MTLEDLPVEILIEIAMSLPDLDALDNLLRASPRFWTIFDRHGVQILNRFIESAPLDNNVKVVMRTIAYVTEGRLLVTTISQLRERVTNDALTHGQCRGDLWAIQRALNRKTAGRDDWQYGDEIFSLSQLPPGCAGSTARAILSIHRRVTFQTLSCLKISLRRFRRLDSYHVKCSADGVSGRLSTKDDLARQAAMYSIELDAPEWVEEQVMARAFWRIQFIRALKRAVSSGAMSEWSASETAPLMTMGLEELYRFDVIEEELKDYFAARNKPGPTAIPMMEHSLILTAVSYLSSRQPPMPRSWTRSRPVLPPRPADQEVLDAHWSAWAWRYRCILCDRLRYKPEYSRAYRRLGLPIWSEVRLELYGIHQYCCGLGPVWFSGHPLSSWALELEEMKAKKEEGRAKLREARTSANWREVVTIMSVRRHSK
ncbi:hypothetical protein ANO11243_030200 [Dothideomycetidae sp. 11243]|nr:hypothetical protein ANO11243_030200 [fungal sp. No.11243]